MFLYTFGNSLCDRLFIIWGRFFILNSLLYYVICCFKTELLCGVLLFSWIIKAFCTSFWLELRPSLEFMDLFLNEYLSLVIKLRLTIVFLYEVDKSCSSPDPLSFIGLNLLGLELWVCIINYYFMTSEIASSKLRAALIFSLLSPSLRCDLPSLSSLLF